jgi:hypothetical protein
MRLQCEVIEKITILPREQAGLVDAKKMRHARDIVYEAGHVHFSSLYSLYLLCYSLS